jgi:hypothetical protein
MTNRALKEKKKVICYCIFNKLRPSGHGHRFVSYVSYVLKITVVRTGDLTGHELHNVHYGTYS